MAFHDVSLPEAFQYQSSAGAGFSTIVQATASGHEFRIARQSQPRHRFVLRKELQTEAEAKALKAFAIGRRGALHSFRLKDFSDYTTATDGVSDPSNTDVIIGVGDGTETTFQLLKVYDADGDAPYQRVLTLPVDGTVVVTVNGVSTTSFTVNGQGQIVLSSAPTSGHIVRAGCEFDVPVRFEASFDRWQQMQAVAFQQWNLVDLSCVEVLSEVEQPERWSAGGATDWGEVGSNVRLSLNDGMLQGFDPTTAMSAYLPSVSRIPGGGLVFVITIDSGASGSLQLRDELGTAVGSALSAGDTVTVGLMRESSTATWVVY